MEDRFDRDNRKDYGSMYSTKRDELESKTLEVEENNLETTNVEELNVEVENCETEMSDTKEESYISVNVPALNLRAADRDDGHIIDVLHKNNRLRVVEYSNEWVFVEFGDKIGYVKTAFTIPV